MHHSSSAKKTSDPIPIQDYGQRLLRQDDSQLDYYDPFESPPSFLKAQRHQLATSIGIPELKPASLKEIEVCPCCENPIYKQPLSICCNEDQLLFLGVGYPLYYKLARYVFWCILLVLVVSGTGVYYLLTQKCGKNCLEVLGINIVIWEEQQGPSSDIQLFNMFTCLVIFLFSLYIKSLITSDLTSLQAKVLCPSQYTIMLQNLPKNFEQFQLRKFLKDTLSVEPVTINLAYNIQQLETAYEKRNLLTIELRKMEIRRIQSAAKNIDKSDNGVRGAFFTMEEQLFQYDKERQMAQQIQKCDRVINDYKHSSIDCDKNGTAFVTFDQQQTVLNLLQLYQTTWLQDLILTTLPNPHLDTLYFKGKWIKVSRAPAPREIIWQNLSYSYFKSVAFQLFFIFAMFLLIYFAFKYQFMFSKYAFGLRQKLDQSAEFILVFQAVVVSLIVILLNSLLRIVIYLFTKLKRHHSHTSEQSSFCFYYTLLYVFNACFMVYLVHGEYSSSDFAQSQPNITQNQSNPTKTQFKEQTYDNSLLLLDIHFIMIANAFSEPLFKLLDPIMWYKIIRKRYIKSLTPEKNPYTQMYVHQYFQGHEISNGDNYQYLARILIVTVWFAYPAPLGVVFSLLGLTADYWIGKIMFLRLYKKPQNISKTISNFILNSLQLLPLIYICGVLQFTYKSTCPDASLIEFMSNFFNYSITVSVLILCLLGYVFYFRTNTIVVSKVPYSEIKNLFGFNYETENPITKFRGEMNYLQNVLKSLKAGAWSTTGKEDLDVIRKLALCQSSPGDFQKMRAQVSKVKIKMQKSKDLQSSDQFQLADLSDKQKIKLSDIQDSDSSQQSPKNRKISNKKKSFFLKRTTSIFV